MNLSDVKNSPLSSGRTRMLKFLENKKLTRGEAVTAKCFECCGGYIDGRNDCCIEDCPLYQYMPYGKYKFRPDKM